MKESIISSKPPVVDRNIYYQTSGGAPLTEQDYDLAGLFKTTRSQFRAGEPGGRSPDRGGGVYV